MATGEEIIEIEGNIARVITKTVSRIVPLDELIKNLERRVPVTLPSIGRTQVFAYWDETDVSHKQMFILAELGPSVRSITKIQRDRRTRKRYRLAFPWTYFWFRAETSASESATTFDWIINSGQVFFAKERYVDVNSKFIVAASPNIDSSGSICWGTTGVGHNQPLGSQIDQRVAEWYNSNFNSDLDGYTWYPYASNNFRRWVEESTGNPNCWLDWEEFHTHPQSSVKDLLNIAIGNIAGPERFVGQELIPVPELPFSFGRWEEWWSGQVPAEERQRALIALQNAIADSPEFVPAAATPTEEGDGGVVVDA